MTGHNGAPVAERRVVGEYEPEHDVNLFMTSNPTSLLELVTGVKKPAETVAATPADVVVQLDGILKASQDSADEWGVWSYDETDRRRVFTPWFDEQRVRVGRKQVVIDTRLHVAFGSGSAPQPIVHVEKRLRQAKHTVDQGTVYEGFELVWNEGRPDIGVTPGIWDTNNDKHVGVSPSNELYWGSVTSTIQKAHEALVGPVPASTAEPTNA